MNRHGHDESLLGKFQFLNKATVWAKHIEFITNDVNQSIKAHCHDWLFINRFILPFWCKQTQDEEEGINSPHMTEHLTCTFFSRKYIKYIKLYNVVNCNNMFVSVLRLQFGVVSIYKTLIFPMESVDFIL